MPARSAETQLFSALDRQTLDRLVTEVEVVHLPGGEPLLRQGDPGDCLYVVALGRLRAVVEQPDGSERRLGEAGRGATRWARV